MTMSADLPILYSFRRCPYAMRARLALHASGQACELREIVLRDKAPEFLAASPKGTVPVVMTPDGGVIEESLDVMLWALEQHDPEGWLSPSDGNRDAMMALIARCDTAFKPNLDAYKYASRDTPEKGLEARAAGAVFLTELDAQLSGTTYLFGERLSLADTAIFPFVRQFANVDRTWFDAQPWLNLIRWLSEWLASQRFADVMKKYAKWQAGDAPIVFE
ncbi:MAG: glutathione S-transferase [Hyphomicrobiaceae bacterium]